MSAHNLTLRKKCPHSELSVRTQENADQNNSEYGHFLHRISLTLYPQQKKEVLKVYILMASINGLFR